MPQTLLLADDSVTIQRVIELTFADEDIDVLAVSDGDQAIERIDAHPPDIVLVDVGMPGRSGYEVAQHIKESPRLQHIPVLLLTGAFEPVDETRAASVGCDGVLAKPFEPQLVIARVKDLLGRSVSTDVGEADVPGDNLVAPMAESEAPAIAPADDIWAPKPVDSAEPPKAAQVARLDSYFAELDQAFAALGDNTAAPAPKTEVADRAPIADMIDWFGATPGAPPPPTVADLPLASIAPAPPAPVAAPELAQQSIPPPVAAPPEAVLVPVGVHAPPAPVAIPPLADAFAEFLDAEQDDPLSSTDSVWPATLPSAIAGHAGNGDGTLSDKAIEAIAQRVLDRLSDAVVRESVTDLVSAIAERLIREEIERIKASIQ